MPNPPSKAKSTDRPEAKYDRLGYKRLILDYHYSEFVPYTLENANADDIINAMDYLGIDSLLLYAKDQWGNVYHKTESGHNHMNVPFDLFGQVSRGLKAKGIETIAYLTVNWDEGAARAHPEWQVADANGRVPRMQYEPEDTGAKWAFLCLNTGYRGHVLAQVRELVENYDMAALFLDILLYQPGACDCYCPACQAKWRERYGGEIPRSFTAHDRARYLDMITDTFDAFYREVKAIIEATGKDIWTTHNFGVFYTHDDYVVMEIDPLGRDYFRSSLRAKTYRARSGGGEVELIGHRHNGDWDFTTKPIPTLKWEAATVVAHNCAIMYVDQPNIKGDLDPFVYKSLKEAFVTADELSPHAHGTTPYAEIALLDSERSMFLARDEDLDQTGAYKLLTELHVPFDIVSEIRLDADVLSRFSLLVISGTQYISPENADIIKEYVRRGGNLMFCYRTAFADAMGKPYDMKAFGMVNPTGKSSHLVDFIRPHVPVGDVRFKVRGFETFEAPDDAEFLAAYTPPCIDVTQTQWVAHQPMPGLDTEDPAIVLGNYGQGKFIYFGCRIFKEYLSQDYPAIRSLVRQCIEKMISPKVRVEASRAIEAVFARAGNTFKVFLINGLTSKPCAQLSAAERPIFHANIDEIIPIHDITIEMNGFAVRSASNLAGQQLDAAEGRVKVPTIDLYDVITIEVGESAG